MNEELLQGRESVTAQRWASGTTVSDSAWRRSEGHLRAVSTGFGRPATPRGLTAEGDCEAEQRLEGKLGYRLGLFDDRFTGTPNLGFGFSDDARDHRIGWRLVSVVPNGPGFEINLDATRKEAAGGSAPPAHGVTLSGTIQW